MKHTIEHSLSPAQARQAAQMAFESYRARYPNYSPTLHWVNENHATLGFNAAGKALSGSVSVHPHALEFTLDVPLIFRVFQKKAIDIIDREARMWIAKLQQSDQKPAHSPSRSSHPA